MDVQQRSIVIGAGIGGLAVALRLRAAGRDVLVLERAGHVGGKMRTRPSPAGDIDTGPTVLTMKPVFDALFDDIGEKLEEHVTLENEPLLARHWWRDGAALDIWQDSAKTREEIAGVFGARAGQDYARFARDAARLFDAFDQPMMQSADPKALALTARVLREPGLIGAMAPLRSLAQKLDMSFSDPHLRQLFGRYATYVGGSPYQSPAVLSLISHSEASGVWRVKGGMHKLAQALRNLGEARGIKYLTGADVTRIEVQGGRVAAVHTGDGRFACAEAIFNGDPRALTQGLLGAGVVRAVPPKPLSDRSLSAYVWAFASGLDAPDGMPLAHHNVFFARDPAEEFGAVKAGEIPREPTLYVCAEDRGTGLIPPEIERFEIIMNAAPLTRRLPAAEEKDLCRQQTFPTLAQFGVTFRNRPPDRALTAPKEWEALFPGSAGSLYGQSPHGMMAAFQRPTAKTRIPGLYLVGGGAHPGAGVPMATLSAKHAAGAILGARTSISPSRPTVMPGGMSTA
ncbi:MAG: 1-hydroxycarotenoid 3,4-desaturase CrtD [Pseudomonadota bacterium]